MKKTLLMVSICLLLLLASCTHYGVENAAQQEIPRNPPPTPSGGGCSVATPVDVIEPPVVDWAIWRDYKM